ncbi:MAG TPA: ABC transporter ATP-binding protein [Candidatus Dormibacteraeota bacterium]|nr:ABC transporter ATP-binding protein [Candidatus Dormibacteraeota bacterium]
MNVKPLLEIRHLSHTYETKRRRVEALRDINLEVRAGEFMSLVGPSGCGKTTLLRIINGLTPHSEGSVVLDGVELRGVSRDMGFVFQDINLLPWRSVVRNVEIGLEARGLGARERRRQALNALRLVGLEEEAEAPPYTLSGGMQQRVGVARALAVEPKVLLMDEPFGHLDNFTRESLQIEISKLCTELGMTVVFVTHDVDEAIFLSDRIALFHSSPGRLARIIDVDLPRPRWQFNVRAHPLAIRLRELIVSELDVRRGLAI